MFAAACGGGDDSADSLTTTGSLATGVEVDEFGCAPVEAPAPELLAVGEVFEHDNDGNDHAACPPAFVRSPPTSGAHFDAWQNCGFYTEPIRDETAVHALEHGAVWIAYQSDLPADELAAIEAAVANDPHLLAAPYPGLENPLVLSAWTRQLAVDRWSDPTVAEFLGTYVARLSPTAPEAGASCGGAVGQAPDQPDANLSAIYSDIYG